MKTVVDLGVQERDKAMKHYGDITKLSGYDLPIVDVITGGSPCQDLSVAGKRAGLDGERSGLFMEQIRVVKEMREHDRELHSGRSDFNLRPRYMVWENVPGAFSSNKGKDFQAVLTEIARIAEPECPIVPMPEKGKWPKSGVIYDDMGGVVSCLESTRCTVLGSTPEKKTYRTCRRFWRTQRSRSII